MKVPNITKSDPNGCHARALDDEPIFTLLARDKQSPDLVRKWAKDRESNGDRPVAYVGEPVPEHPDADIIAHARYVAASMEVWRYENDGKWRK